MASNSASSDFSPSADCGPFYQIFGLVTWHLYSVYTLNRSMRALAWFLVVTSILECPKLLSNVL